MNLKHLGPNQTELSFGDYTILFSYSTPVAYFDRYRGYCRTEKFWSKTTTGHINKWLSGEGVRMVPQDEIDDLLKDNEE